MSGPGGVVAVLDVAGVLAADVDAFCDPARGAVAVAVRPGARRSGWLAAEITTQLGRTYGVVDRQRGARHSMPYALAALVAEDITDLVVFHAEWLSSPGAAVDAVHLAITVGTRLWLVADAFLSEDLLELLAAWDVSPIDAEEFTSAWNTRPVREPAHRPPAEPSERVAFPASLPADDFLTFRCQVRRELDPQAFAAVDTLYRRAFAEALAVFAHGVPAEEEASAWLQRIIAELVTNEEVTVAVRAFQAAAFRHGVAVEVDLARFLRRCSETLRAVRLTDEEWARFGHLAEPHKAAAGVLAALGLSAEESARLGPAQVASDGTSVEVAGGVVAVPEPSRRYLVAQHLFLLAQGFPAGAAFLSHGVRRRRPPPVSPVAVGRLFGELSRATGIALKIPRLSTARSDGHWTHRYGLTMKVLRP